jgi:hypothetical protein
MCGRQDRGREELTGLVSAVGGGGARFLNIVAQHHGQRAPLDGCPRQQSIPGFWANTAHFATFVPGFWAK